MKRFRIVFVATFLMAFVTQAKAAPNSYYCECAVFEASNTTPISGLTWTSDSIWSVPTAQECRDNYCIPHFASNNTLRAQYNPRIYSQVSAHWVNSLPTCGNYVCNPNYLRVQGQVQGQPGLGTSEKDISGPKPDLCGCQVTYGPSYTPINNLSWQTFPSWPNQLSVSECQNMCKHHFTDNSGVLEPMFNGAVTSQVSPTWVYNLPPCGSFACKPKYLQVVGTLRNQTYRTEIAGPLPQTSSKYIWEDPKILPVGGLGQ